MSKTDKSCFEISIYDSRTSPLSAIKIVCPLYENDKSLNKGKKASPVIQERIPPILIKMMSYDFFNIQNDTVLISIYEVSPSITPMS